MTAINIISYTNCNNTNNKLPLLQLSQLQITCITLRPTITTDHRWV